MPDLSHLEAASTFWDLVLYISLTFAIFGAASEFVANWTTWIKATWKTRVEKTSVLVVFLGSVVGLVATWKLANISDQIIAILNKQTATAQAEADRAMATAADAHTRLAEARERTARVEQEVANAYKAAKDAEAQARKFEAIIATSNARAEEAKQIAERERLERVKLEAQVAPRRLSREQEKSITSSLSRFSGRNVTVVSYSLDVEGGVLATQIISVLKEAGILVEEKIAGLLVGGSFWTGVILKGPTEEQDFIAALTTTLMNDGRLAVRNEVAEFVVPVGISKLREKAVFILVGAKPPRTNVSK
ncbi:MAG: hypothetical protein IPK92_20610 [Nitrospira sp.]|nr:hypothetical protein [Nitrospira sp.]